jgi:hypothetical protein
MRKHKQKNRKLGRKERVKEIRKNQRKGKEEVK